jgi:hypothetical protein
MEGRREGNEKQSDGKKQNATSLSFFLVLLLLPPLHLLDFYLCSKGCERAPDAVQKGKMRRGSRRFRA